MSERSREAVWRVPGMPDLLAMTALGFAGLGLMMPTAPLWAVEGGADSGGAGQVNAVLMLFTVIAQALVPLALRHLGWRTTVAAGMVMLGAPALVHPLSNELPVLLALAAARGIGFGILTVCGSKAVGDLSDPGGRGRAIGAYGLAIAVPQFILLPLAPWAVEQIGFTPVFVAGACPVLAIFPVVRLAGKLEAAADRHAAASGRAPGRAASSHSLWRVLPVPVTVLFVVTVAGGALMTFAPQMIDDPTLALLGLLGFMGMGTVFRWYCGRLADRRGTAPFFAPLLLVVAVGLASIAWAIHGSGSENGPLVVLGMTLAGVGYGGLQNLTMVEVFTRAEDGQRGAASVVWNIGFDTGIGLGALLVGAIAAGSSFTTAMVVAALACLSVVPVALFRRDGG